MMHQEYFNKISEELAKELPGFSAQKEMAPANRQSFDNSFEAISKAKKSAVLILLLPVENKLNTVLIVRTENEGGNHSGQIAFPGGSFDNADENLSVTALRETEEEIGVNRKSIRLIGKLTSLYIPVSNYLVEPFVGYCNHVPDFKIQQEEVEDLLQVDINEFLVEENKTVSLVKIKNRNITMEVPCYNISGKVIWGATAMIIAEFSEVLRRIKK